MDVLAKFDDGNILQRCISGTGGRGLYCWVSHFSSIFMAVFFEKFPPVGSGPTSERIEPDSNSSGVKSVK